MKHKLSVSFSLLASLTGLWAQSPVASVTGVIHDPSGSSIPSAIVKARNLDTNVSRSTVSNESGSYTVVGLAASTDATN